MIIGLKHIDWATRLKFLGMVTGSLAEVSTEFAQFCPIPVDRPLMAIVKWKECRSP